MIMMPYGWPWPIIAVHSLGRLLASHRPWKDAFLTCWQRLSVLPAPA